MNHYSANTKFGNIYISDKAGVEYTSSLPHVVRDHQGQCDFEKLNSIEGVIFHNSNIKHKLILGISGKRFWSLYGWIDPGSLIFH